ncbi:MAG: GyrI-like domain-containing protein [Planctomycetes bacterium]|nr:GyrI-like domain-containing protein [Planctomycetota bacterium]
MSAAKIDLVALHKSDYTRHRTPTLVDIDAARYLAIDGAGAPGSAEFQDRIGVLYGGAYTLKFAAKAAGRDFVVCKLEALWGREGLDDEQLLALPQAEWPWRLMIRVPDFVGRRELAAACLQLREKGHPGPVDDLALVTLTEGRCVQMLHVGPYAEEDATIARMREFAASQGLAFRGLHHEIYLSDPRRVEPARLQTILRRPVG